MMIRMSHHSVRAVAPLNCFNLSWIKRVKFGRLLGEEDFLQLKTWGREALSYQDFSFDAITSVPSHPLRSLLEVDLAWEWARCLEIVSETPLLYPGLRHRSLTHAVLRRPQKTLSLSERRAHFVCPGRESRFQAPPLKVRRRVLLVDDVLNSGCSFLEASEALEAGGHQVVGGLVLAGRSCLRNL
jgi:predicted amidophosphoribosyltransferase